MKQSTQAQRQYAKKMLEIREYQASMDIKRQEEKERFEQYESLESTQIFKTANNLIQKATQREMELNRQYLQLAREIGNESFETIKSLFEEKNDVSDEHFEMIYSSIKYLLYKVKKMSEDARVANAQYNQLSAYEELFIQLINEVDQRFVVYAPIRILSTKSRVATFKKVSEPMARKLYERIKEMGILEDESFKKIYAIYFRKCFESEKQETKKANENI